MAASPATRAEIEALLDWYAASGVDVALEETPLDRFRPAPAPSAAEAAPTPVARTVERLPPSPRSAPRPAAAAAPVVPQAEGVRAAREAAAAASTLDELRAAMDRFEGCSLRTTATQLVFADGNPQGRVMFIGEAPGRDEDIQGLPFVGRSGQLLDRMLAAIGLGRDSVYIANVVPWRPPGNRTPTPQETAVCRPFLDRQIALADPDFLILLGGAAAKEVFATSDGILKLRGRWRDFDIGKRTIRAMASLHPAYLLRQPTEKRLAWRDFLALKAALDQEPKS